MPTTLSLLGTSISLYYLFWFFGFVAMLLVGCLTGKRYGFSFSRCVLYIVFIVAVEYALTWVASLLVSGTGLNFIRVIYVLPVTIWLISLVFKDPFGDVTDFLAPLLATFHGVALIGCIFPGCCHGYPAVWGLYSNYAETVCFPLQLFEAATSLLIAGTLLIMMKKNAQRGRLYAWYLLLFGGSRFLWEFLRDDEKVVFGISEPAIHAMIAFIIGIVALIVLTVLEKRSKVNEKV